MPRIVVFLGPSLPRDEAERFLKEKGIQDAECLPPAKRGDIYRAARDCAKIICLIDGVFFQDCSVAHKEVLFAMERGARVIGASSMGALRASELDVYGMEGVGEIYQAYRSGDLISDDEVALIFDPFTFEPLSEPLVNIRFNLYLAQKSGIIDAVARERLFEAARSLYFPERTYERVLLASETLVPKDALERLRDYLKDRRRDFKREDAVTALERVKEIALEIAKGV
ncbi:MAG TPA: TfuA-related McrA-glycine thioamidation protein [Methanothrix sp.]|nr:TfuA-related McrA-glycine thioamidation protein [Methanothrix sp.]